MTVSSLRDRIITEMGVCHSDPSYTYPSPQEWQLDNPHAMSKTLAEVLGKAIYPEISASTLLAWREPVIDYYDPTGDLPAFPSVDDRYISTATANGWTADYIYTWDGSSWSGFAPEEGCTVYNESTDVHQTFNGTTWGTLTTVTKLDDIQDPDSSHVLTMSDKTLTWRFTNPVGGMYFEWIGAASGHLLELNQNTGNPSAGTHLLHLEATDTDVVPIHIRHSAKTADALITDVAGDTNYRFHLTADGKVQWGSGSAAEDTNLYRSGAGVLRTDGSFDIGNIPNYSSGTNVLVSHSGVVKYRLVSDSILSVGDFGEAVDDRVNSLLVQGSGIVLNYNDVGDSLTISLGTHALNHGDGGSDEIAIDWSQITSGVPAQATDWPTWSQVTGKPTNFVYGSNITSANSGYYTKVANDDQIEPALLQDILDGATWYTDCWSKFRIVSVDTNASSSKVVVLGASNELEKRDIDSRVWGSSSLLSNNSLTTNRIPKYTGSNELSNSIVASGDHHLTVEPAGTSQQTYQLQLINAYNSNAARSYIGQYQGHLYISNNRYYNGSWNSDTSDAGCYYVQSSNGHHIFKHFSAGSNTTVQDLVINGPSGFIRSEHNFRLGSNLISNDGTGGLTFDGYGGATLTHNQAGSNGLSVVRTGNATINLFASSSAYGAGLVTDGDPIFITSNNDVTDPEFKVHDGAATVKTTSTVGTDKDAFIVASQSGGGFSVRCSDLSVANPTWKLRSNGSEAMELFVGTNDGQLTLNTDGTTTFGGSVKLNNLSSIDATRDIRKTSDETNSTNSLQDDNHLTFTAEANTKYYVDFELFVNLVSSASNEGFKFDITGPSSPTAVAYRGYGISDTDGMVIPSGGEATAFSTSRTIPFSVTSAHNGVVKIRLYLDNGSSSGSVTLRWAWDQGGGLFDNVTVYKESFMTVKSAA